ncbi:hypothetical protein [Streptomyces sp. NPDC093676]|uniref:hypothetical protein n=1 Tax=Streptomyces sp. NPDC093676 TaxID=3366050 RepID=UPI00382A8DB6
MTRFERGLCTTYGAAALFLAYITIRQALTGPWWTVAALALCTLLPLAAIIRECEHVDQLAIAEAVAERAARLRTRTQRHTASTITDDALDELYADRDSLAEELRITRCLLGADGVCTVDEVLDTVVQLQAEVRNAQHVVRHVRRVAGTRLANDECGEWERHGYHSAMAEVLAALDSTEQPKESTTP